MQNSRKPVFALAGALALTLTACSSNGASGGSGDSAAGTLNGSGASTQQNAQKVWRSGFTDKNPAVRVNYDPTGSGTGRQQFLGGQVKYAGSDSALKEEEIAKVGNVCATNAVVELPVFVSPIAIAYNLPGVNRLQLNAETVAKIFRRDITMWNDPAIAASNPGVRLPKTEIIPVNRADKSGTTKNFTAFLNEAAPSVWTDDPAEKWPFGGTHSAEGTSGVVQLAAGTPGTITYADASQIGELKAVQLKVGDEYVGPTPQAAAAIVDGSKLAPTASATQLVYKLKRDGSIRGAYPVVLVSYEIGCQRYKNARDGELVRKYFAYIVSREGQQKATDLKAGNAPISDTLREKSMAIINTIK